jgi:O-antigen/teichoic acid export membrane protein
VIVPRNSVEDPAPQNPGSNEGTAHPVLRNTLFLTAAQLVVVPSSILTSALTARFLGPAALGYMYIGATFNALVFLAVEWGQAGAVPGLVATDRGRAGRVLGTGLAWRAIAAIPAYGALIGASHILGYGSETRVVMTLYFAGYFISAMANACLGVIVGFERLDVAAYRQILEQVAVLLIVVPILIFGGGVNATLLGHAAVTVVLFLYVWRARPAAAIGRISVSVDTLRLLLRTGTPFFFLSVAMVLQPTIDAAYLSKLAPPDVVGWYSAARRLVGFLIFPASALVGALYPTLCRLYATDLQAFRDTSTSALRFTAILAAPVALGCLLYPDIGISLYDRAAFLPAEDNLRIQSLFVFLLYFSMPLGICVLAAGRQRAWSVVQASCVAVSVALDPVLVPFFQRRTGNGGLGLSVAAVVSELVVLGCGVFLAPRGVLGSQFWRSLGPALGSGAAMVLVARLLHRAPSLAAAPVAVAAYVGCLWASGGIDREFVAAASRMITRKLQSR